jgi:ABC-type antimicrobial peptide transport system permease subunit
MDPNVPAFDMRTMEEQRDVTLVTDRLVASLALAFGLVATLLAAVGLYGLMAFTVAQRTREIGLRMALGAPSASVTWLVMKEVLALVSIGTAMAVPAAWVLAGLVRSQLYGITPNDPASMAGAALTLALVAAIAGCVPAIRAARIDPMRALRCE